jgi:hypothetical protein
MPVKIINKRNGIYIPPNKKVNKKFWIVYRHPSDPFGYDFHHFSPQQLKLMREKLKHISEQDLSLQKLFDLYGIYAFDQMKREEKIPKCETDYEYIELYIEQVCASYPFEEVFHQKYYKDYLNEDDYFHPCSRNGEYRRMIKLPGVIEALDAIYMARCYQK